MKKSEFRIGNLLLFRDKRIVEVSNLGNSFETIELVNGLRYGSDDINEYNPIELTEEWLLKLGFEKDEESKTWSILTSLEKFDYLFEIENKYQQFFQPDFLRIDIKYVHQLQNLYFALTGQELKFGEL